MNDNRKKAVEFGCRVMFKALVPLVLIAASLFYADHGQFDRATYDLLWAYLLVKG